MIKPCVFCEKVNNNDLLYENEFAACFRDGFPISNGHTLIIPKDHITPIDTTSKEIKVALIDLKKHLRFFCYH